MPQQLQRVIQPASAYYGKIGLKSLHDIPPDFVFPQRDELKDVHLPERAIAEAIPLLLYG